ncbi:unnamed protein product [Parnassius mnemosyne]|uniref:Uncharacterized protein n=1 Tax=Parnassius mnemosyne TaxID=213953 RepID=A0AAV1KAF4_9NEOP
MPYFSRITSVKQCCLCVDLKIGCFIIAIIGILDFTDIGLVSLYPICRHSSKQIQSLIRGIVALLAIVANITVVLTSIIFIYGLIKNIAKTAVWFMYAIFFSMVVRILYVILTIISGLFFEGCYLFDWHILHQVIMFFVWFHFLSVVKSYHETM